MAAALVLFVDHHRSVPSMICSVNRIASALSATGLFPLSLAVLVAHGLRQASWLVTPS